MPKSAPIDRAKFECYPHFLAEDNRDDAFIMRRALLKAGWPKDVIININFPDLEPEQIESVEVTAQGRREIHDAHAERRTDLRGRDYYWVGFRGFQDESPEGTDLYAVRHGRISVTPLHIDLTHRPTLHALKGVLGGAPPKA